MSNSLPELEKQAFSSVKRTALRIGGQVSAWSILGSLLTVPLRIITAGILQPTGYGLVGIANLIQEYAGHADLGLQYGMSRQVPILLGRREPEEAQRIACVVLAWMTVVSVVTVVVFIAMIGAGMSLKGLLTPLNAVIIIGTIFVARASKFISAYIRAHGIFEGISAKYLITGVVGPVLTVVFVIYFDVTGALAATLLQTGLMGAALCYFLRRLGRFRFRLELSSQRVKRLIRESLLLYVQKLTRSFQANADLILLALFLTPIHVGYLAFARSVSGPVQGVVGTMNLIADRQILLEWGRQGGAGGPAAFQKYLGRSYIFYLLVVACLLASVYFVYDFAVTFFLVQYQPALGLARVLFLDQLLMSGTTFPMAYLNASGWLKLTASLSALLLIIKSLAIWALLQGGYGLSSVVWVSTATSLVFLIGVVGWMTRDVYGEWRTGLVLVLRLAVTGLILLGLLSLSAYWMSDWRPFGVGMARSTTAGVLSAILRLASFVLLATSVFSVMFRRFRPENEVFGTLSYLRQRISSWIGPDSQQECD